MNWTAIGLLAVIVLGVGCSGAPRAGASATASMRAADDAELRAIIDAIEKGWEQADGAPFERHFLDFEGARYVESGGQNEGLRDLVDHHVVPEGGALELALEFSNVETHIEGDFAWALADVDVKATFRSDGRKLHKRGYETFLFRRVAGEWKVVHTHSSTRDVKPAASDGHAGHDHG